MGKIGRSQTGSIVCKKGKNRVSARFAGFADANPAQARLIVRLVSGRCPCFSLFCALRTSNARFTIFPTRTQPPCSGHSGGGFLSALEDIVAGWQECGGREMWGMAGWDEVLHRAAAPAVRLGGRLWVRDGRF